MVKPAKFREALQKKPVDFFFARRRSFIAEAFLHALAHSGKQPHSGKDPLLGRHHPRLSHFREQGEARVIAQFEGPWRGE
jgi:hypothetical protein